MGQRGDKQLGQMAWVEGASEGAHRWLACYRCCRLRTDLNLVCYRMHYRALRT